MQSNEPLGQSEIFSGAMSTTVTRNVKQINIIEEAVFDTLGMMYNADTTDTAKVDTADDASGITFPALATLQNVKSFKLTSGIIQVIYYAAA